MKPVFGEYKTRLKFIKFGLRIVGSFVVLEFALIKCRILFLNLKFYSMKSMKCFLLLAFTVFNGEIRICGGVDKRYFSTNTHDGGGAEAQMSHAKAWRQNGGGTEGQIRFLMAWR